jgi:hypothetical protein
LALEAMDRCSLELVEMTIQTFALEKAALRFPLLPSVVVAAAAVEAHLVVRADLAEDQEGTRPCSLALVLLVKEIMEQYRLQVARTLAAVAVVAVAQVLLELRELVATELSLLAVAVRVQQALLLGVP